MLRQLRPAFVMILALSVLTGLAYPLAITGVAQLVFPQQANGSLIRRGGVVIGSSLIGQQFAAAGYFHGRPSALTGTDPNDPSKTVATPYDAANSGGSNLGPTAKALIDRVRGDAARLAAENPAVPVPVDLVTSSASGLDPDISPAAALFQLPRVARARHRPEAELRGLIAACTEGRILGFLGAPRVNVLRLNLALDAAAHRGAVGRGCTAGGAAAAPA